tara:strand:- start:135 stop:836 length:702 start_codon:yes stop_codon:yes gene_type:complete
MKKINPNTGKYYKFGDLRNDGYRFRGYDKSRKDKDGFYFLEFTSEELFNRRKTKNKEKHRLSRDKTKEKINSGALGKRINKLTGDIFKKGDTDKNGMRFWTYDITRDDRKVMKETWITEDEFIDRQIKEAFNNAKRRSKKKNISFNLDFDYLVSIFPKKMICPILKIKMYWGYDEKKKRSLSSSPTIDRFDSSKGYENNNVQWISFRANHIKNSMNLNELNQIISYLESIQKH